MASSKNAAQYLLLLDHQRNGDGIENLKVQRLLYFACGIHSLFSRSRLIQDNFVAWRSGPVIPSLYEHLLDYGKNKLPVDPLFNRLLLTRRERDSINAAHSTFGHLSEKELSYLSQHEQPWMDHEHAAEVIPLEEIKTHFHRQLIQ